MKRILSLVAAFFLGLAGSSAVLAQGAGPGNFPEHPVRIIVPFPPSGPTDVTARIIAQKLTERLGKKFLVENQAGASGNIGTANAAKAPADGYTLALISTGFMVNPSLFSSLPFDPVKDFSGVTLTGTAPSVLVVHNDLPAKNVKELVALIKQSPGKYAFGHAGHGTAPHLSAEMLRLSEKLDATTIPFKGSAPVITSALGGHTPIGFAVVTPAVPHVKAGKLRALAVTSDKRTEALPDVPTLAEAGFPNQEALTVQGMVVRAGTPRPIVEFLSREIRAVLDLPDVKQKLTSLGYDPVTCTPAEFDAKIKSDIARWAKLVKDANIKLAN